MKTVEELKSGIFPIVVAFSGGKDSIAMVLYLLENGIDKQRIHLHHHDVDGRGEKLFDWECTESYCKAFAAAFGLTLLLSYRKGGILREIYRCNEPRQDIYYQVVPGGAFYRIAANRKATNTRLKFPAVSAALSTRWCSGTVKIDVLSSVIRRHPAYQRQTYILTGERRQESPSRQKYKALDIYPAASQTRRAIWWRPILDWTETEVWAILARWKVQPHPAYMLGWGRCSCQLCIFGSPNIWATVQAIAPWKVKQIRRIEQDIGFTLYHHQTILERADAGVSLLDLQPFWVQQALGEFTAPILVTHWELPKGAFANDRAGAT